MNSHVSLACVLSERPEQLEVLQKQYDTERGLTEVMGAAEHLLSELENYAAFLEEVQGRDPWMEAEPGKVERLREIYERVTALGLHLGRDAALPFSQAVQKYEDQLALGGDRVHGNRAMPRGRVGYGSSRTSPADPHLHRRRPLLETSQADPARAVQKALATNASPSGPHRAAAGTQASGDFGPLQAYRQH